LRIIYFISANNKIAFTEFVDEIVSIFLSFVYSKLLYFKKNKIKYSLLLEIKKLRIIYFTSANNKIAFTEFVSIFLSFVYSFTHEFGKRYFIIRTGKVNYSQFFNFQKKRMYFIFFFNDRLLFVFVMCKEYV
jgi:hypothetical protein